jgi:hypothetical protein
MSTNDSIPLTPEVSHSNVVTIYDMTNTISKITYVTGAFLSFASKEVAKIVQCGLPRLHAETRRRLRANARDSE